MSKGYKPTDEQINNLMDTVMEGIVEVETDGRKVKFGPIKDRREVYNWAQEKKKREKKIRKNRITEMVFEKYETPY